MATATANFLVSFNCAAPDHRQRRAWLNGDWCAYPRVLEVGLKGVAAAVTDAALAAGRNY